MKGNYTQDLLNKTSSKQIKKVYLYDKSNSTWVDISEYMIDTNVNLSSYISENVFGIANNDFINIIFYETPQLNSLLAIGKYIPCKIEFIQDEESYNFLGIIDTALTVKTISYSKGATIELIGMSYSDFLQDIKSSILYNNYSSEMPLITKIIQPIGFSDLEIIEGFSGVAQTHYIETKFSGINAYVYRLDGGNWIAPIYEVNAFYAVLENEVGDKVKVKTSSWNLAEGEFFYFTSADGELKGEVLNSHIKDIMEQLKRILGFDILEYEAPNYLENTERHFNFIADFIPFNPENIIDTTIAQDIDNTNKYYRWLLLRTDTHIKVYVNTFYKGNDKDLPSTWELIKDTTDRNWRRVFATDREDVYLCSVITSQITIERRTYAGALFNTYSASPASGFLFAGLDTCIYFNPEDTSIYFLEYQITTTGNRTVNAQTHFFNYNAASFFRPGGAVALYSQTATTPSPTFIGIVHSGYLDWIYVFYRRPDRNVAIGLVGFGKATLIIGAVYINGISASIYDTDFYRYIEAKKISYATEQYHSYIIAENVVIYFNTATGVYVSNILLGDVGDVPVGEARQRIIYTNWNATFQWFTTEYVPAGRRPFGFYSCKNDEFHPWVSGAMSTQDEFEILALLPAHSKVHYIPFLSLSLLSELTNNIDYLGSMQDIRIQPNILHSVIFTNRIYLILNEIVKGNLFDEVDFICRSFLLYILFKSDSLSVKHNVFNNTGIEIDSVKTSEIQERRNKKRIDGLRIENILSLQEKKEGVEPYYLYSISSWNLGLLNYIFDIVKNILLVNDFSIFINSIKYMPFEIFDIIKLRDIEYYIKKVYISDTVELKLIKKENI